MYKIPCSRHDNIFCFLPYRGGENFLRISASSSVHYLLINAQPIWGEGWRLIHLLPTLTNTIAFINYFESAYLSSACLFWLNERDTITLALPRQAMIFFIYFLLFWVRYGLSRGYVHLRLLKFIDLLAAPPVLHASTIHYKSHLIFEFLSHSDFLDVVRL